MILLINAIVLVATTLLAAAPALAARERIGNLVLESGPGADRALAPLAQKARDFMPRIEADLGVRLDGPLRMVLIAAGPGSGIADPSVMQLDTSAPRWAAGYVVPARRIGAIRLALASQYPYGNPASVLAHEVTHMMLDDAVPEGLPIWFQEGVATWVGRRWGLQDMVIHATAVLTEDAPTFEELDDYFGASEPLAAEAYATSFSFVSWTVNRHGTQVLRDMLARARAEPFEEAWAAATGATLEADEAAWRSQALTRYRWVAVLTASATLWAAIGVLAFFVGAIRKLRQRRARERWPDEPDGPDTPDGEGGAPPEPPSISTSTMWPPNPPPAPPPGA